MSAGHRRSKADIERELQDLARALDTPAPDYSGRVLRTLAAHAQEPAPLPHRRARRAVLAPWACARPHPPPPTADTGYALILTEIANAGHPLFEKILGTNTSAIMVTVARHPGVFINGPQEIITIDPSRPSQ